MKRSKSKFLVKGFEGQRWIFRFDPTNITIGIKWDGYGYYYTIPFFMLIQVKCTCGRHGNHRFDCPRAFYYQFINSKGRTLL